jgi:glycosyltransferase involved in cell wall biosynthesis
VSPKPIKTVHLTNYFHKSSGGIRTFYLLQLDYAERHQRPMTLIVPGEIEETEVLGEYTKIRYVPAKNSPLFDKRYRVIMPWQFMLTGSKVREILLEEQPDLIEICDKYTLSLLAAMIRKHAFRKLGRPVLVHFSCERMDDNIYAFITHSKIGQWFARRAMGNYNTALYDFFITVSEYITDEYFDSTLAKNNPRRSKVFFNWCWRFFRAAKLPLEGRVFNNLRTGPDLIFSEKNYSEDFRREIREEIGIPQDSKIIFYAGRLSPEKNIKVLFEMMQVLAEDQTGDYRLVVAGGGPLAESFEKDFETKLPGKLKMLGHLADKQKLANLYSNCDVFVHPNPREPSGNGVLEAMASGAPVIAPNSGGILTYANQENAWLVTPTGENYARAVKDIFADSKRTREKISNAIQTAKDNDRETILGETFEFYDRMYQDFQNQKELFDYKEKPDLDFAKEIAGDSK